MKMMLKVMTVAAVMGAFGGVAFAEAAKETKRGEELFKQHCAVCHPNGGNIVNPKKTLKSADLKANKIVSAKDIVNNMRKPGPGMNPFDAKTVPDKDAKLIAEYILKTFK